MTLKKCAICDEVAEFSDANEMLELHSERYKLVQCCNGSCKQAAWGDAYWNENQDFIAELKQKNEVLCETFVKEHPLYKELEKKIEELESKGDWG